MSYDLDAPERGIFADLAAKLDVHVGSVDRLTKALERRPAPPAQPVFGRTAATGVFSTGVPLVLRFPLAGPDQGHFWYVRSIVVGGLSPTTSATGRADVYVSSANLQAAPSLAALGLADWRQQYATLPAISFHGRGEIPLRLNEELFIVITAATNAQAYVAAVQFEDMEESPVRRSAWDN